FPSILHKDPRYFRMGHGSAWKRAGYAMSRVVVTHSDRGTWQFNASEIAGNAAAAGAAHLYYPSGNRSGKGPRAKIGLYVVSDAGFNVLKEFWRDMRHKILHRE